MVHGTIQYTWPMDLTVRLSHRWIETSRGNDSAYILLLLLYCFVVYGTVISSGAPIGINNTLAELKQQL